MFMTLYTQYPSKLDDIDFIVDYYANQIAVSKALNDSEKDAMFSALSVAAYSPRYWIDELGIELTTAEE